MKTPYYFILGNIRTLVCSVVFRSNHLWRMCLSYLWIELLNSSARYISSKEKRPSLCPKISLCYSLRLCGARSVSLRDHWLITAYNQQVHHFFVILGHIKKRRERRSEPETVPPPDSQASAGLSQWQNGRFLCLCLFLSPAVTVRRVAIVSAASAGGQGCSLSRSGSFSLDLAARLGEPGESRRPGSKQSWSHLNELEIQLENGLLSSSVASNRACSTHTVTNTAHSHLHVHLLLCSRGIPGFL